MPSAEQVDPRGSAARAAGALPTVRADLVLLHAPAVFDFRDRGDIYFPYLSTSGDVPITPLYEYFPLGFKTLQRYLGDRGFEVRLLNLATLLLRWPELDVARVLAAIDAPVVGIDLHWMVHVQGSLEVARLLKQGNSRRRTLFGGISSTYYAAELAQRPEVDLVMRGYDTHAPMAALLERLRVGGDDLSGIPNLWWTDASGGAVDNGTTHLPESYGCGIDWSATSPPAGQRLPILELMSTQNAGCAYDCGWCGGSRQAFHRIYGTSRRQKAMARKPIDEVAWELGTVAGLRDGRRYHFYSVGSYNEPAARMGHFIDQVASAGLRSVSYEQFQLTDEATLRRMVAANANTTITLSPESHDMRVAKLAGRGVYTPEQMEAWLERALDIGIRQVDVWYFVGMPEQDEASVMATVDYCRRLLSRFGARVTPLVCPMIPFLDPASTFFEQPEAHGYQVFCRSVEDHRRTMTRASLVHRINYQTRWLSRPDLVRVGYAAVRALLTARAEARLLPTAQVDGAVRRIDDALELTAAVTEADALPSERERALALRPLEGEIRKRNQAIFFGGVSNQAFPLARSIGGRWFDETLWDDAALDAATGRAGD
ncbi:MAG: cobalamin-dependent protein [Polyangiaceae bacterium]